MCGYCDFKDPTPLETHRTGCDRVGKKPMHARDDEVYGREGIWLGFIAANDLVGLPDRYEIVFWEAGVGYGSEINYCPMCGRDLRGGES